MLAATEMGDRNLPLSSSAAARFARSNPPQETPDTPSTWAHGYPSMSGILSHERVSRVDQGSLWPDTENQQGHVPCEKWRKTRKHDTSSVIFFRGGTSGYFLSLGMLSFPGNMLGECCYCGCWSYHSPRVHLYDETSSRRGASRNLNVSALLFDSIVHCQCLVRSMYLGLLGFKRRVGDKPLCPIYICMCL